jgi:prepilin-type N-terminal cleavage/methylation domain-containing protein
MKKIKNKRGFSLLEVLAAMFIFVLIMMAVSMSFSSLFGGYSSAKSIQKDLENAQYSMNLMAKSLRTSSVINSCASSPCNITDITVYNYSKLSGKCERYVFTGGKIRHGYATNAEIDSDKTKCLSTTVANGLLTDLTSNNISNAVFSVVPSNDTAGSEVLGKVTISMKISGARNDVAKIQTSVSLRSYEEAGL